MPVERIPQQSLPDHLGSDFEKALEFAEKLQERYEAKRWTLFVLVISSALAVVIAMWTVVNTKLLPSERLLFTACGTIAVGIIITIIIRFWQQSKLDRAVLVQVVRMLHELKGIYDWNPVQKVVFQSRLARLEFTAKGNL